MIGLPGQRDGFAQPEAFAMIVDVGEPGAIEAVVTRQYAIAGPHSLGTEHQTRKWTELLLAVANTKLKLDWPVAGNARKAGVPDSPRTSRMAGQGPAARGQSAFSEFKSKGIGQIDGSRPPLTMEYKLCHGHPPRGQY